MTGDQQRDPVSLTMWGGGVLLLGLGQLALPFESRDLFAGGESVTVWDLPASFRLGTGGSVLRQFANRATELWIGPGALVVTLVVLLLVIAAVVGRVPRAVPAIAAWAATAWQVGSYATLATVATYVRTPRPGLGIVASTVGALLISTPVVARSFRSKNPAAPPSQPFVPEMQTTA
jgi:hypothetical protein